MFKLIAKSHGFPFAEIHTNINCLCFWHNTYFILHIILSQRFAEIISGHQGFRLTRFWVGEGVRVVLPPSMLKKRKTISYIESHALMGILFLILIP